jgi:hypothetical protein
MEKGKMMSTRVLDKHGRIGPFFFKEFLFVTVGCAILYFVILEVSLFVPLKKSLLIVLPLSCLALVSLLRFVFIKKVDSPWYIHKWVAYRFLVPQHIKADSFARKKFKLCLLIKKK